jgi:hypothetical protein
MVQFFFYLRFIRIALEQLFNARPFTHDPHNIIPLENNRGVRVEYALVVAFEPNDQSVGSFPNAGVPDALSFQARHLVHDNLSEHDFIGV